MAGARVDPADVRLNHLALSAFAVVLAFGVLASPAAAQDSACDAVLENATDGTAGPGGALAEAIGDRGSEIGEELSDRWFDARIANATTDGERAEIIATEVDRIEARLERTEACVRTPEADADSGQVASELTERQLDALERRAATLHHRLNASRDHATALSTDRRDSYNLTTDRFERLERRTVALRESIAGADAGTQTGTSNDSRSQ